LFFVFFPERFIQEQLLAPDNLQFLRDLYSAKVGTRDVVSRDTALGTDKTGEDIERVDEKLQQLNMHDECDFD